MSLMIECPNPGCDHEARFSAFVDTPDAGCEECGTDIETLREYARENGDDDADD